MNVDWHSLALGHTHIYLSRKPGNATFLEDGGGGPEEPEGEGREAGE